MALVMTRLAIHLLSTLPLSVRDSAGRSEMVIACLRKSLDLRRPREGILLRGQFEPWAITENNWQAGGWATLRFQPTGCSIKLP